MHGRSDVVCQETSCKSQKFDFALGGVSPPGTAAKALMQDVKDIILQNMLL